MPGFGSWSRRQQVFFLGFISLGTAGITLLNEGYFWPGMAAILAATAVALGGVQLVGKDPPKPTVPSRH